MGWYKRLKLGLQIKKVSDQVDKETKAGFSWKINGIKAAKNFLIVAGLVGLIAVGGYYSNVENLGVFFTWLPASVRALVEPTLAGMLSAAFISLVNWATHRKNQIVMMVPVEPPKPNDRRATPTPVAGAVPVAISVNPADVGPPPPIAPLTVTTEGRRGLGPHTRKKDPE